MNVGLFIGVMVALSALYLILGWMTSKKHLSSHADLFLAGRGLTLFPLTATLLATQIGGGMFIGTAQDPFRGILYVAGLVLGFLFLGLGVAQKFRAFNVETLGGIFGTLYKSKPLQSICDLISIVTLCGILLSQALAMESVVRSFTGPMGDYLFPGLWLTIVVYTLLGGLYAVVITDVVQIGIIVAVFTTLFGYSLFTNPVSFFSTKMYHSLLTIFDSSSLAAPEMIKIVVIATLYSMLTQDVAQRFFAAKTQTTARLAALYASVLLFAFAIIPFYFGVQAQLQGLSNECNPLFAVLEKTVSGLALVLGMCALMAALSSTIDSLLCTISAIICSFAAPYIRGTLKNETLLSQLIIIISGVGILIGSYHCPKHIIDTLISSYELATVCLFVPVIAACIKPKESLHSISAYYALLGGFLGFMMSAMINVPVFRNWGTFIALGLSLTGYIIGDLAKSKKSLL